MKYNHSTMEKIFVFIQISKGVKLKKEENTDQIQKVNNNNINIR